MKKSEKEMNGHPLHPPHRQRNKGKKVSIELSNMTDVSVFPERQAKGRSSAWVMQTVFQEI